MIVRLYHDQLIKQRNANTVGWGNKLSMVFAGDVNATWQKPDVEYEPEPSFFFSPVHCTGTLFRTLINLVSRTRQHSTNSVPGWQKPRRTLLAP